MFRVVIPACLAVALTACGGGGGGGSSPTPETIAIAGQQPDPARIPDPALPLVPVLLANDPVPLSDPTLPITLGSVSNTILFQYYRDGSVNNAVSFIYPRDIDGDGIDEIFFVAFETQPNARETYSNTSVHILGWENGTFKEITYRWLPGTSNQVEGVGDLCFGDFDGNGKIDVFLSAYTDMNYAVYPYALMNNGSSFTRVQLTAQPWQHAVACGDINGDGYDDVYVANYAASPTYFGSRSGLLEYRGSMGGSGATLGDFLGNGTMQVVATDAGVGYIDARFYTIVPDHVNKTVTFNAGPQMPPERIDTALGLPHASHDIRARAVDFDNDGKLDVIVFAYRWNAGTGDIYRSEIQFLKNIGGGQFVDVTDTIRVGYDTHGMTGYFPQIRDFNGDGRVDIFVSQPEWNPPTYKGTTLLMQDSSGKFVDTIKSTLSATIEIGGGQAAIAKGPNSKFYLVKESAWKGDGWTRVSIQPMTFN